MTEPSGRKYPVEPRAPAVLAVDVGGSHVKEVLNGVDERRRFASGDELTAEQMRALDTVDEVLGDTSLHRHARLRQGDLMVIDNRRLVHGRTDFIDSDDPQRRRLLLRTWIDAR